MSITSWTCGWEHPLSTLIRSKWHSITSSFIKIKWDSFSSTLLIRSSDNFFHILSSICDLLPPFFSFLFSSFSFFLLLSILFLFLSLLPLSLFSFLRQVTLMNCVISSRFSLHYSFPVFTSTSRPPFFPSTFSLTPTLLQNLHRPRLLYQLVSSLALLLICVEVFNFHVKSILQFMF